MVASLNKKVLWVKSEDLGLFMRGALFETLVWLFLNIKVHFWRSRWIFWRSDADFLNFSNFSQSRSTFISFNSAFLFYFFAIKTHSKTKLKDFPQPRLKLKIKIKKNFKLALKKPTFLQNQYQPLLFAPTPPKTPTPTI